jgi:hypothetical protein
MKKLSHNEIFLMFDTRFTSQFCTLAPSIQIQAQKFRIVARCEFMIELI